MKEKIGKRFRNLLSYLTAPYRAASAFVDSEGRAAKSLYTKAAVIFLLAAASFVLSVMNLVKGYYLMLATTLTLALGFTVAGLLCCLLKKWVAAATIISLLVAGLFSFYAVTGNNEGFAILWILLVPPIAMSLLGIRSGTILGLYFEVFLLALFYTPLRTFVVDKYSPIFCARFPVLYTVLFIGAILLAVQRETYFLRSEQLSRTDVMTGLSNRLVYETTKVRLTSEGLPRTLVVVSCDINGLKRTNDSLGHAAGDELICEAAKCLTEAFPDAICICRVGGDEFSVLTSSGELAVRSSIQTFTSIAKHREGVYITSLSASFGYAAVKDHEGLALYDLEKLADAAMYESKKEFYEKGGNDRRTR